jgi:hypothetical protein
MGLQVCRQTKIFFLIFSGSIICQIYATYYKAKTVALVKEKAERKLYPYKNCQNTVE